MFLGIFLLYLLIGVCAPFLHLKEVTKEKKETVDVNRFYGETVCVDRARILETNRSAWEERIRLLNRAKERIILATFDMRPGESTKDILSVIYEAAERGVEVKILVDGISGLLQMEGEELFYAVSSHPRVEIKLYNRVNPLMPWRLAGRMHDKYVLVDDEAYVLGGRNMFDYFIGDYPTKNRSYDREVLVCNTAAGTGRTLESSYVQVENYFTKLWNSEECVLFHNSEKLAGKKKVREQADFLKERYAALQKNNPELFDGDYDYTADTRETNRISLLANPTHVYGKEPEVFNALQRLMASARERVVIHTPYIALSRDMEEGMREIGTSGKNVRLLLNAVENGDNFFGSSDYIWNKKKVMDTGVQIYEFAGGDSYHGKSILVDDRISVIGSYNLDMRSTYVDTELMLVIDSREVNRDLDGYMEALQARAKKVVTEDTYEIPEGLKVWEAPLWKRALWRVVGFLMIPFRFTI